ncbi:phosphoglycerate dehydrogenase, partial [Pseudomonas fluorescens]|nr:phosphoglycerate dehydrogenase [Pseudomonas fluorescens]
VEPSSNSDRFKSPLQGLGNVILTPHIGGSTEEAQERIGGEVARKLVDYFITGSTMGAVNFPEVQLHLRPAGVRFSHVHRNVPGMLRRLNEVFLQRDINIVAQYLETSGDLGYVVLDADLAGQDSATLLQQIRALDGTIGARLVFEH